MEGRTGRGGEGEFFSDTFIRVADDCPATAGIVPVHAADRPTMPAIPYELLTKYPYRFGHEKLIFEVHVRHQGFPAAERKARKAEIWAELFRKPYPCMRASMLPKKYGWGVHDDKKGKIALFAMESAEYRSFTRPDRGTTVLKAMRNHWA